MLSVSRAVSGSVSGSFISISSEEPSVSSGNYSSKELSEMLSTDSKGASSAAVSA